MIAKCLEVPSVQKEEKRDRCCMVKARLCLRQWHKAHGFISYV